LSAAPTTDFALAALLDEAQERGFLGPGPVRPHIDLALDALPLLSPGIRVVDLGSGGGALALPLAVLGPPAEWLLVESSEARADFLRRATGRLGLDRATVLAEPAEVAGRRADLRATCDLVVARSFGPPATTAECAAPLLRIGGRLAVTEPPGERADRWPGEAVSQLGLAVRERVGAFQTLEQVSRCPDRFPRRTGVPRRHPLF
jgi:16S rRNA (guanine527-N7)-methyltransferase